MNKQAGLLSKNDFAIILTIVLLAAVFSLPHFFVADEQGQLIVIANDQQVLYEQPLLAIGGKYEKTFAGNEGKITFAFDSEHGVKVSHASCPDQICVHTGYINKPRQLLVCLPGKIYAEIKPLNAKEAGLDAILR